MVALEKKRKKSTAKVKNIALEKTHYYYKGLLLIQGVYNNKKKKSNLAVQYIVDMLRIKQILHHLQKQ